MTGVSSVAKGYSNYVDSILDNRMSQAFKSIAGMEVRTEICRCAGLQDCRTNTRHNFTFQIYLLAEYVDFFAFGITALISGQVFRAE